MARLWRVWLRLAITMFAMGCGAKTGLRVPPPEDAAVESDAGVPCVELLPDGGPLYVELDTRAKLASADVVFLIDVTASMLDEIEEIQDRLRDRIAPAIEAEIPDTQLGVATFADFPVEPFGAPGDTPFSMLLPVTEDLADVQSALDAIEIRNGLDDPESQVEALYQLATGAGLGGFVPPSFGCPMGGRGYPCFREEALPIVLLFTDERFHNGPGGTFAYPSILSPAPHTYDEMSGALASLDLRVLGFDSGAGTASPDLIAVATDSGAVDAEGEPLVFDIGEEGQRLSTTVVDAMKRFANGVVFDVRSVVRDPDPDDGVDATEFIDAVRPLRAEPMTGIERIDEASGRFLGVKAGTRLVYQLTVVPGAVVPGAKTKRFRVNIVFFDEGGARIGNRLVELVIPGDDEQGCPDEESVSLR